MFMLHIIWPSGQSGSPLAAVGAKLLRHHGLIDACPRLHSGATLTATATATATNAVAADGHAVRAHLTEHHAGHAAHAAVAAGGASAG